MSDPGHDETAIAEKIAMLDLEAKVRLLTGRTTWRLHELPEIGLRELVLSDGPVGVRGTREIAGETSLLFPSPTAVAATWDPEAARALGRLFAVEARRHGVDVVLAPQVNIQRTPAAGRHFECFSEDPLLTTQIAAGLVEGIQHEGVAACIKHYVLNDSETGRTSYVARIDERPLREVYLAPFEHLVTESSAWSIMAAYNGADVAGESAPMTDHRPLVRGILKDEWGFDGVVMSDWLATKSTVGSAQGGLDLVMPGPGGPWEQNLLDAVRAGAVSEVEIDDKVARLLRLAARTGGFGPIAAPVPFGDERAFLRSLAARAIVAIKRDLSSFPASADAIRKLALIGPNAVSAFVLGGGSSVVDPAHVVSVAEGFERALPDATVTLLRGGDSHRHLPEVDFAALGADPRGENGAVRVSYLDDHGAETSSEVREEWTGWQRDLDASVGAVVVESILTVDEPGVYRIELGAVGRYELLVDGVPAALGTRTVGAEVILDSSINSPEGAGIDLIVTEPRAVHVVATLGVIRTDGYGNSARGELRLRVPGPSADDEIAEAVETARRADVAVVVVGTNSDFESEGWDRPDLQLPGRQNELVERVLAVAPDAVIVVNAGAPVVLPWLGRAKTVLWAWFPGQECGDAIADVVLGHTEPAGRLPWTLPAAEADVPVLHAHPDAGGFVHYDEGIHVGYRGWLRAETMPAAPFGHGLGWTDWEYESVSRPLVVDDGSMVIDVELVNVGERRGTEVVQVYLELEHPQSASVERPVRWLAGSALVTIEPGRSGSVRVQLPRRAFEVWDVESAGWVTPGDPLLIAVGRSVGDIRLRTEASFSGEFAATATARDRG